MQQEFDVLCLGAAIVDIPLCPVSKRIFESESYPLDSITMTVGGDAINEATILSRLGKRTALASLVGRDAPGDFLLSHCAREGIDASRVRRREDVTTSINVGLVTADGERTFVTNRNGSLWKMTIEDVDLSAIGGAKILSFASIFNNPRLDSSAMCAVFERAKTAGMTIAADMIHPRLGETLEDIRPALSYLDYFFPNYSEASLLTGEKELSRIAASFQNAGVGTVIVKTGRDGCYVKGSGDAMEIPAVRGIRAIDTIGAGDNFVAGFLAALADGEELSRCAVLGNVTASISVESVGATTGVRSFSQVRKRLARYDAKDER